MASTTDDDARTNRRYWDAYSDRYQREHGAHLDREAAWGTWAVPEREIGALGEVDGLDVLELGCGAAQWSDALARRGARTVGLDVSARQLAHAHARANANANAHAHAHADEPTPDAGHRRVPAVVLASAAAVPLADDRFDLVFCDHGAMSYVDPDDTLPEVARVLRPGGRLVFNVFTPFTSVCWNDEIGRPDDALHEPYFGLSRWDDVNGFVSFELGYGDWIRAFRRHGFVVDDLHELRPSADATSSHHTADERVWARRWPSEHIWCAHHDPTTTTDAPAGAPTDG